MSNIPYPGFNPLPHGRGFFSRNRLPGLTAFKALLITLLVVSIGLVIVLKPDIIREVVPIVLEPPPQSREVVVPAPAGKSLPLQPEQPGLTEAPRTPVSVQTEIKAPVTETTMEQPVDWLRMLYPELVRIAELERQPIDMAFLELVPMLDNDDPAVRLAVIESLGDMATSATSPALSIALGDPSPQVRKAALEALASQDDAASIGSIETLLQDPDREVRLAAIDALVDLEQELAVHALAGLLGDPDAMIRQQAVFALGEIGGDAAPLYLLRASYDSNQTIRASALHILAEINAGQ